MDPRRLRPGEWVAGIAGAVLLLSLFLDWYGVEGGGLAANAWESFRVVDVFLALAALLGIAVAVMTAFHRVAAVPIALASLLGTIAGIALLLVVWRALDPVGWEVVSGDGVEPLDATREVGLWLGLASSVALVAGAFMSMRDETTPDAARVDVPIEVLPPPEGGAA